ncbi:MAG: hypothetical protein WC614_01490 [bacterium]
MRDGLIFTGSIIAIGILLPILVICGIVLFFSLFKRGIEID